MRTHSERDADRQDHSRHVEAHHFCKHLSADFHQCIIYDSDKPDARLIGIEYIVTEKVGYRYPSHMPQSSI